jgi:hypothetical protein
MEFLHLLHQGQSFAHPMTPHDLIIRTTSDIPLILDDGCGWRVPNLTHPGPARLRALVRGNHVEPKTRTISPSSIHPD